MAEILTADASPEKRLFISLITRDISLVEALLDIIDNSINSAIEPFAPSLKIANDYQKLLNNKQIKPKVEIFITVDSDKITVKDNAGGISLEMAKNHVFKFGRAESDPNSIGSDRLSVYGIGLKRAMFKFGNRIEMTSDHLKGGFGLELDVNEWERTPGPWNFEITSRPPAKENHGTTLIIKEFHDDVKRRLNDGVFEGELIARISRTYTFFIGRIVEISLNNNRLEKEAFEFGDNYSSKEFESGSVSCLITAGIALTKSGQFQHKNSGWFVFCNGRGVLYADKTTLTGWGGEGLPIFQPKHRPFLGIVFFVSSDPEMLPWTTTKASINEVDPFHWTA